MKNAPRIHNEASRLNALIQYQVLDTLEERSYDDITFLASAICKTPIAIVSLIDSDRQWFKSHHGLEARETPRDISFCGHAIEGNGVFQVPDSVQDPRFADNPLVTGTTHVRFYAGAPLISPDGFALGTLCVIDHNPRSLDLEQTRALEALARQVVYLLEMKKSMSERDQHLLELKSTSQLVLEHQQQLIYASKMSSMGAMASGLAHEINNPLAIILSKLSKVIKRIEKSSAADPTLVVDLKKAIDTAWRIQKIVKGLLSFSRDSKGDSPCDSKMQVILDSVLGICDEKMKSHGISFSASIPKGVTVHCRPNEISQVLLNLIYNSIDAIAEMADKWISLEVTTEGILVIISVTDSGNGIPSDVASKIMEPFFTTKAVGKGTGLGLSISKGLVETQGGELKLDPNCPNTRFVMNLPAAAQRKAA